MKKDYVDLDPFTFGDSKACQNLATILNGIGDVKLASRISKTIHHYHSAAKAVYEMPNLSMRSRIFLLLRKEVEASVTINTAPEKVKTHTFNVIKGKISEYLRKTQVQIRKEISDAAKQRNINGN